MKKSRPSLPKNIQQSTINKDEFVALAKRVKQSLQRQKEWLEQNKREYTHHNTSKLF